MGLADDIKQKAQELGFDLVGITDASAIGAGQVELFTDWLKAGFAGQMGYMHRNFQKRINPAKLLAGARSVIVTGLNYAPPRPTVPPSATASPTGRVANYAQYEDYHPFIKRYLRKLTEFIIAAAGREIKFKICVDSAPVAERSLAARAGIGFIGKNRMLINPQLGQQILLGEIITDLDLSPDEPIETGCSDCNKCIDACPTGALGADGHFDANKCISYLTIEYKGRIPFSLAEKMGDWLFGCDECVLACPLQKDRPVCRNGQFRFYPGRGRLDLQEILSFTQQQFDTEFAGSAFSRPGLEGLKRNARICLANTACRGEGKRENVDLMSEKG